jgi:4-amino-4-deoxy-L-arabinose transferase-like glycosyltransferase
MGFRNFFRSPTFTWTLLLTGAAILLIVIPLFQKGCFMDGLLYQTVAYNYSIGEAGFWKMKFTNTSMPFFCEQPPLYFYMLGNLYNAFGAGFLTDRLFTLSLLLLTLLLCHFAFRYQIAAGAGYFPLFCFFALTIPIISWTYDNELIETLVNFLVLTAIILYIFFLRRGGLFFMLLFAVVVILLFLAKGFQSCFIVLLPFVSMGISQPGKYKAIIAVIGTLLLFSLFMAFYAPAEEWFRCYFSSRLKLTFRNQGATTDYHAEILIRFLTESIVPLVSLFVLILYLRIKKAYPVRFVLRNFYSHRLAFSLFICSMAGVIPFSLSLVQRGFYLVPAFICFLMALVLGMKRYWLIALVPLARFDGRPAFRFSVYAFFVFTIVFLIQSGGSYKREEDLDRDTNAMLPYLKKGETVAVEPFLWNHFSLHSILYRKRQVSLSPDTSCALLVANVNPAHNIIAGRYINLTPGNRDQVLLKKR